MPADPPTHPPVDSPVDSPADRLDRRSRAAIARLTGSLSPASLLLAWLDWALHLAVSPGRQQSLAALALQQQLTLAGYLRDSLDPDTGAARAPVALPVTDRRFEDPAWRQFPFDLLHQGFLLNQQWWDVATHGVAGVSPHHERLVAFWARQWLDVCSPSNAAPTNPVVIARTLAEGGANLLRGAGLLAEDLRRRMAGEADPVAGFVPGHDVAATPGRIVLRNRVMELIQYAPATGRVHPEPVLIVPAWIMKYYILDLSPDHSLIRYLVAHGHTVFCISWKNPGADERDLSLDDYRTLGIEAALAAVGTILPRRRVHAVGYCLGGTLLAIAAAAMARDDDRRLATMSLFAAQTDFSEPGELGLFIDESQVALLEAQMAETGYLTSEQMAGAFRMLRSYDLLWSRLVRHYLLGERGSVSDLMAWNADATRMPARMHGEYLRRLFLRNDLAQGRLRVGGRPVSLGDLALPTFVVGTETDHVAPWHSVYKLHRLAPVALTFVLTNGGHNVGIVNPPDGEARRAFRMATRAAGTPAPAADDWYRDTAVTAGSWWPAWQRWLAARSGRPVAPPSSGCAAFPPLADAPGDYVLERSR